MGRMFKFTGIAEEITWQPTDVAGCKLWVRSDLAWQDAAKTVPCVNSSLIYTGEDKSGLGNDVVQATEAKRPVYLTNQINGHPAWRFDGIDDILVSIDTFSWPKPCTVYIVLKQISWTNSDFIYDAKGIDAGMGLFQYDATPKLALHDAVPLFMTDILSVGTWGIVSSIHNGGSSSIRLNTNTPTLGAAGNNLPGGFTLGRIGLSDVLYSNIDVVEILGYRAVSDPDDALVMTYFNTRYAIY